MTKNYEKLFEQYKFIIADVYNKLRQTPFVVSFKEDLEQEGYLSLWNGLKCYDENKGSELFSYLYSCVRYAMLKYIQKLQPRDYIYSLDYQEDPEEDTSMYEFIVGEDPNHPLHDIDLNFVLSCYKRWLYKKYTKTVRQHTLIAKRIAKATIILSYCCKDKFSYRDIQDETGIGRTTCSTIIEELRQSIIEEGGINYGSNNY